MDMQFTDQQAVADDMKRQVNADQTATPGERQRALKAISTLESLPWHPLAFRDAIQSDSAITPSGKDPVLYNAETVPRIVVRYRHLVAPSASGLYGLGEAAEYLGLSEQGVKYHVYDTKRLTGTLKGKTLIFTQQQLDDFVIEKPPKRGPQKKA